MQKENYVLLKSRKYGILCNPKAREKYPHLYEEICIREQPSPWYRLSDKAYEEYRKYIRKE